MVVPDGRAFASLPFDRRPAVRPLCELLGVGSPAGQGSWMCRHPFPFELLTRAEVQGGRVSDPVLDGDWNTGGTASRLRLVGVIFTLMTALVLAAAVIARPLFG